VPTKLTCRCRDVPKRSAVPSQGCAVYRLPDLPAAFVEGVCYFVGVAKVASEEKINVVFLYTLVFVIVDDFAIGSDPTIVGNFARVKAKADSSYGALHLTKLTPASTTYTKLVHTSAGILF
jgi:hypothetical protein